MTTVGSSNCWSSLVSGVTKLAACVGRKCRKASARPSCPPPRCKNGKSMIKAGIAVHIVPLVDRALDLIGAVPRGEARDFVFGRRGVNGYTNWSFDKKELDARIAASTGKPLPPWTVHDLRRTFVTHVSEHDFAAPHVVEAIINHISGGKAGVAGVYNKALYLDERRKALEQWAAHVAALVAGKNKAPLLVCWSLSSPCNLAASR